MNQPTICDQESATTSFKCTPRTYTSPCQISRHHPVAPYTVGLFQDVALPAITIKLNSFRAGNRDHFAEVFYPRIYDPLAAEDQPCGQVP